MPVLLPTFLPRFRFNIPTVNVPLPKFFNTLDIPPTGEKVEIIEKETNQQKDKEAALRQLEMEEESARKEEERRAYEEVKYNIMPILV